MRPYGWPMALAIATLGRTAGQAPGVLYDAASFRNAFRDPAAVVAFVHVPKCAGTAFLETVLQRLSKYRSNRSACTYQRSR